MSWLGVGPRSLRLSTFCIGVLPASFHRTETAKRLQRVCCLSWLKIHIDICAASLVFLLSELTRHRKKMSRGKSSATPIGEAAFSGNLKECMSLILQWFRMGALGMAHKALVSSSGSTPLRRRPIPIRTCEASASFCLCVPRDTMYAASHAILFPLRAELYVAAAVLVWSVPCFYICSVGSNICSSLSWPKEL